MDNQTQPASDAGASARPRISKKAIIAIIIVVVVLVLGCLAKRYLFTAATVNGDMISKSEFSRELEKQFGKRIIDALIAEKLVEQEAEKRNITVSDIDVEAEVAKIGEQLKAQGTTLDAALESQGLTLESLKKQIATGKRLEKILADKITVTDAEIADYIKNNKIEIPAGSEAQARAEVASLLSQQKLAAEADKWIEQAKTSAKIKYYVNN